MSEFELGKLILVSGLSGSGKATLIAGALNQLPELVYLQTYTTRPKREGEDVSHEYIFVDDSEYMRLRESSNEWDHAEYGGFWYGADAAKVKELLTGGKNVICSVAPDLMVVDEMAKLYGVEPVTVWIKVSPEVAKQRVYHDDIRDSRNEDVVASTNFDYIFEPRGEIASDVKAFPNLLKTIVQH